MNFERFWRRYLRVRKYYRDDAWIPILLERVGRLRNHNRRIALDVFLDMVQQERDDWYASLDVIETYGESRDVDALVKVLSNLDITEPRYGYITKVLAKREVYSEIVRHYLASVDLNAVPTESLWLYVTKNVADERLFNEAMDRYFNETGNKVEYDYALRTYLSLSPDRLHALKRHYAHNNEILTKLNSIG